MAGTETQVVNTKVEDEPIKPKGLELDEHGKPILPSYIKPFLSVKLVIVAFVAMTVTWSFGWLYVGETWDPQSKLTNMQVGILNCDNGMGSATQNMSDAWKNSSVIRGLSQPLASTLLYNGVWSPTAPANTLFFWLNFTCDALSPDWKQGDGCGSLTDTCFQKAVDAINNGYYWNILFFPGNFTYNYLTWFPPSGTPVAALPARSYNIYGRGRSYSTYSFINGYLGIFWSGLTSQLFSNVARVAASNRAFVHPRVYGQPFYMTAVDLHPVEYFGQNFASYVFCILIWLGSTFCVAVFNQYKTPAEIRKIKGEEVTKMEIFLAMGTKALGAIFYMFILSVLINMILFALGQGRTEWNKNAGYSIAFAWWLSFCNIGMNAFLLHALGPDKFSGMSAFMLVLQLTSGGAIFSEQLSHPFFMIGRGLPFYYGVRGFRTIFFGGLENVMYVNWLVIFAWNMVATVLTFVFVTFKLSRAIEDNEEHAHSIVIALAA